jgi:CBS domain-containing protein
MRAGRVMTRDVVSVLPEMKLENAHKLMVGLRVRHLPVARGTRLYGILSDRDVLVHSTLVANGTLKVEDKCVGDAMSASPITCGLSTPVSEIAAMMIDNVIDSVPVLDLKGELAGIVTSTDLVGLLRSPEEVSQAIPFTFHLRAFSESAA